MRVLIRADASVAIGTGHVVRCATLGQELIRQGASVAFACRNLPGHMLEWIQQKGFTALPLNPSVADDADAVLAAIHTWAGEDAVDWLIVDHYGLDAPWERQLRQKCQKIMVIDDLANRPHDCDLLLDQNVLDEQSRRYRDLIPLHCQALLGPKYALLRPEFRQARTEKTSQPNRHPQKVLAFFGGSDPTGECFKAVEAFKLLASEFPLEIDLVAGGSNPQFEALRQVTQAMPQVHLHHQVSDMAHLMAQAQISIGAGGTTTWERFCLGLPSLVIAVADNQVEINRALAENGYLIYLGESAEISPTQISQALRQLLNDPERQRHLSRQGMALVDGLGVERVAKALFSS